MLGLGGISNPFGKLNLSVSVTELNSGFRPESGEHKGGHQSMEAVYTFQNLAALLVFTGKIGR